MARFGIYYLRSIQLRSIRIGGKRINLIFPEAEVSDQKWELSRILFEDCYHLADVRSPVATVLDIGANTGCFALAARHFFPTATIHCYEPNHSLEQSLSAHCSPIGAKYFIASVGAKEGRVNLDLKDDSMHSVSREDPNGQVAQVAFRDAVKRLGTVDVLKLDCEGAEWDLFSDIESWASVRSITMEYHLWARSGLTTGALQAELEKLNFADIVIEPNPKGDWGFARAKKSSS